MEILIISHTEIVIEAFFSSPPHVNGNFYMKSSKLYSKCYWFFSSMQKKSVAYPFP